MAVSATEFSVAGSAPSERTLQSGAGEMAGEESHVVGRPGGRTKRPRCVADGPTARSHTGSLPACHCKQRSGLLLVRVVAEQAVDEPAKAQAVVLGAVVAPSRVGSQRL